MKKNKKTFFKKFLDKELGRIATYVTLYSQT